MVIKKCKYCEYNYNKKKVYKIHIINNHMNELKENLQLIDMEAYINWELCS